MRPPYSSVSSHCSRPPAQRVILCLADGVPTESAVGEEVSVTYTIDDPSPTHRTSGRSPVRPNFRTLLDGHVLRAGNQVNQETYGTSPSNRIWRSIITVSKCASNLSARRRHLELHMSRRQDDENEPDVRRTQGQRRGVSRSSAPTSLRDSAAAASSTHRLQSTRPVGTKAQKNWSQISYHTRTRTLRTIRISGRRRAKHIRLNTILPANAAAGRWRTHRPPVAGRWRLLRVRPDAVRTNTPSCNASRRPRLGVYP